jgi:hypothetical protein
MWAKKRGQNKFQDKAISAQDRTLTELIAIS